MFYRIPLTALCLFAVSCSRFSSAPPLRRVAILRFENLSPDPSLDWMGRAIAEIVARDLAGVPGVYSIPPGRLRSLDAALGGGTGPVPGVSSERAAALAAGADRLGYGEYWLESGLLHARLTLDDTPGGRTQIVSASAPGLPAAAGALARQISAQAESYGTANSASVQAYALGLESADPQVAAEHFQESISADPDFEPPYTALAQLRLQLRDPAGAAALLQQALAHRRRMPPIDAAQLALDAANLSGDRASARRALTELARLLPNDPAVWRSLGETETAARAYPPAVEALQKALALQPNDPALLNQLGYTSAYAGDLEAAMRALGQYQTARPADANPLDSMGDVNLLFGRLQEAENFYLQAVRKDPATLGGGDLRKAAMARLMGGDIAGAASLAHQYAERRAQARDPLVDYYQAEWLWASGNRKQAYQQLEEFAHRVQEGPLKDAAAEAYAELAVWSVALGNRGGAALVAQKAGQLAGPVSGVTVALARFLAQPAASAAEWSARADRAFPQPVEKPLKQRALVYALLADRQFPSAAEILKTLYDTGGPGSNNEDIPLLLAWCYLETGRAQDAAGLLRFNPVPPGTGVQPFQVFVFPRLFYLRGRVAMIAGRADGARAQYRLFRRLSGDTPLLWGEEAQQ